MSTNFERLQEAILAKSENKDDWEIAKEEWFYDHSFFDRQGRTCPCGQHNIVEICVIENQINSTTLKIGNHCVKQFKDDPVDIVGFAQKRIGNDITSNIGKVTMHHFHKRGVLNDTDVEFYSNKIKPNIHHKVSRIAANYKVIRRFGLLTDEQKEMLDPLVEITTCGDYDPNPEVFEVMNVILGGDTQNDDAKNYVEAAKAALHKTKSEKADKARQEAERKHQQVIDNAARLEREKIQKQRADAVAAAQKIKDDEARIALQAKRLEEQTRLEVERAELTIQRAKDAMAKEAERNLDVRENQIDVYSRCSQGLILMKDRLQRDEVTFLRNLQRKPIHDVSVSEVKKLNRILARI